jgi:hypothetical protein
MAALFLIWLTIDLFIKLFHQELVVGPLGLEPRDWILWPTSKNFEIKDINSLHTF